MPSAAGLPCSKRKQQVKKTFCGMPKYHYHPTLHMLIVTGGQVKIDGFLHQVMLAW